MHCGALVNDGARFCPKCGAPLQAHQSAAAPALSPASAAPVTAPGQTLEPGGSGGKGKMVGIIAAIAAVAVVAVILLVVKPFGQGGTPANGVSGGAAPTVAGSQPVDASDASQNQQAPAASEAPALTIDEAFAQVLRERVAQYGSAQLKKPESQITTLDGVALATRYDFNRDGTDELMLAYYDPSKNTMSGSMRSNDSYRVEVWAYDGKKAVLAHEQSAENSNGGELYVTMIENTSDTKDKMPVLLQTIEYPNGTIFDTLTTYYGFDGERFVPVKSYEVIGREASGTDDNVYKIDGKEVDKKTYEDKAPYRVLTGDTTPYKLLEFANSSMSWGYDVEGVKELTDKTMGELGAASDVESAANDGVGYDALTSLAFSAFPRDFVCSFGSGGWMTAMTIQKDGTFTGDWHDMDRGDLEGNHPNGVMRICSFEGKFSVVNKVSDTEFELQLDYLRPAHAAEEVVENGVLNKWVEDTPYGLGKMTEEPLGGWRLYLPGAPNEGFSDTVTLWWRTEGWDKDAATLNGYGLVGDTGDGSMGIWFSADPD